MAELLGYWVPVLFIMGSVHKDETFWAFPRLLQHGWICLLDFPHLPSIPTVVLTSHFMTEALLVCV